MNKRGSNVGVIISFVIFISFLVFLYIILEPIVVTKQDKTTTLDRLQTELMGNLTNNNATRISAAIKQSSPGNCILLVGFINGTNLNSTIPPHILVYNGTGADYLSYESTSNGNDLYVNMSNPSVFLTVYSSPVLSPITSTTISSCISLIQGNLQNNYTIGGVLNFTYAFDGDITQLIQDYNSDYIDVKNYFNITASDNFGFNFTYQNETSIGTNDQTYGVSNIYSQSFPITYLTENQTIEEGMITIRVW